jgi:uncharacterized protein YjgD (DUF1641 family)|tara:strand:+ start:1465 stop:1992 length:528 start_codon:yes stop_codon:yes gene_type:complete
MTEKVTLDKISSMIDAVKSLKQKQMQNSTEEIHDHLKKVYNLSVIQVDMEIHKARQTRMTTKIQRYFNSTPLRNAFSRWMAYAVYTNRYYTISQLVDEMASNRQSISDIIKDCEADKTIDVIRKGNTVRCRASISLMDSFDGYCQWRRTVAKSVIGDASKNLARFEKLMQTELAL